MFRSRSFATLVLLTATTACAPMDPGSLLVRYRLGNGLSCSEAGVDEIRVVLDEDDGIEGGAPCEDGEVLLEGLPVGSYDVLVEGLDASGVAIMDNVSAGLAKAKVTGDGKQLETDELVLSDTPAQLQVRWNFGFTSCEGAGIDAFDIEAYDAAGTDNLLSYEVDCTSEPDSAAGYREIPDPDRRLNGRRLGEVGIQALDASGAAVGSRVVFTMEPPSPGYPVRLTLECDVTGCSSSTNMPD